MKAKDRIEKILLDEYGSFDDITMDRFCEVVEPIEEEIEAKDKVISELKELLHLWRQDKDENLDFLQRVNKILNK